MSSNRGTYDASSNAFPSAGGSGTAGAILKGDYWFITLPGTLGAVSVKVNSTVEALADGPGQTASDWEILSPEDLFIRKIEAIKEHIAKLIEQTAPKALVFRRRVFDKNENNWVGILRGDDQDAPVHAITVSYRGITQETFAPTLTTDPIIPFSVVFYRTFELGTDDANAENEMEREIARCFWRLEASPDLETLMDDDERVRGCVAEHGGLDVPDIPTATFGEHPILIGAGRLNVKMQSQRVQNQ